MAPADVFHRLRNMYFGIDDNDKPVISTFTAILLSYALMDISFDLADLDTSIYVTATRLKLSKPGHNVLQRQHPLSTRLCMPLTIFTSLYVLPFYTSKTTRPSPTLNRDAPSVIRARIQTVTLACIVSSAAALYLLLVTAHADPVQALHSLGWWPIRPLDVLRCLLLTALLYLGPIFELIFVDQIFAQFRRGHLLTETLSSWQGYRNYIAGPITEEILFRSVLIVFNILAKISPSKIVFLSPLYFGIAHIHHFYEFTLTHPDTPLIPALLRSLFQFTYTTLFGWYAAFIYVRTGSLFSCIIIHTFCNSMGLPRLWGKLKRIEEHPLAPVAIRGKDDEDAVQTKGRGGELGLQWTVAYYVLLVSGVFAFWKQLWPLTESVQPLVKFAHEKSK